MRKSSMDPGVSAGAVDSFVAALLRMTAGARQMDDGGLAVGEEGLGGVLYNAPQAGRGVGVAAMAMRIDMNCDMGESFGMYKMGLDEEIIRHVSSANIACGFHAGRPDVDEDDGAPGGGERRVRRGASELSRPGRLRSPEHERDGGRGEVRRGVPARGAAGVHGREAPPARQAARGDVQPGGGRRGPGEVDMRGGAGVRPGHHSRGAGRLEVGRDRVGDGHEGGP